MTTDERQQKWANTALVEEVSVVANAPVGGRHNTLNRGAYKLAQLIEPGWLTEREVTSRLLDAAVGVGMPEREARYTIRSAIKAGMRHPRGPKDNAGASTSAWRPSAPAVAPIPLPPPSRPPHAELFRLLQVHTGPVDQNPDVITMLDGRGINPFLVSERRLAFGLRKELAAARHPSWAFFGKRSWAELGYGLLLPMCDHDGKVVSVHARNVDRSADPKGVLPKGYEARGLVLADDAGRLMLGNRHLEGPLWIAEGVPDFLSLATHWGDAADPAPAVLGILAGSWTEAIAARVPDGARVIVGVHHDDAGEAYAAKIIQSLAGRVELWRWTPKGRAIA